VLITKLEWGRVITKDIPDNSRIIVKGVKETVIV